MVYVASASTPEKGCLFCRLGRTREQAENLVLERTELGLVVMNRYPYNSGHLMVAPLRHVASPEKLTDEEGQELMHLVQRSLRVLRQEYKPDGFNLGANLGRAAGAGIARHMHIHIVPRWNGDTNFMPLLGETKVISEYLTESYRRLVRRFHSRSGKE